MSGTDLIYFEFVDGKKIPHSALRHSGYDDINWEFLLKELGLGLIYSKDFFSNSGPPHKKVSHNRIFQHDKDKNLFVVVIEEKDRVTFAETHESEELVLADPSAFIRANTYPDARRAQMHNRKLIPAGKVANDVLVNIREMYK